MRHAILLIASDEVSMAHLILYENDLPISNADKWL
jgi:hypothetical protein